MKDNSLLMIVLAFILGYMFSVMMKQLCGGRLVEGLQPPIETGNLDIDARASLDYLYKFIPTIDDNYPNISNDGLKSKDLLDDLDDEYTYISKCVSQHCAQKDIVKDCLKREVKKSSEDQVPYVSFDNIYLCGHDFGCNTDLIRCMNWMREDEGDDEGDDEA